MSLTTDQCATQITNATRTVITISGFSSTEWYSKAKGAKNPPWLHAHTEILDEKLWKMKSPCLYFLINSTRAIKYVGVSTKNLKTRWAMVTSYHIDGLKRVENEMFHSQCWPHLCTLEKNGHKESYSVAIIQGEELVAILSGLDHEVSALSILKDDPEIAVKSMESWFIKHFMDTLWNKRK